MSLPPRTLDGLYRIPVPEDTIEQYTRWVHADLPELSLPDLLLDEARLRDRLRHDRRPPRWLLQRLDAIKAEKSRRG